MPFKSQAQRRWANSPDGVKALGGPGKVKEWDQASKGMKLPEKVGMKKGPSMIRKYKSKMRTDVVAPARMS